MFLLLLFHTPEFKARHTNILEEELEKRMKVERNLNKNAVHSEIEKFSSVVNQHFESISLLLLKGTFISNNSYNKIRSLLSFDLKQEIGIVQRCKLPKIASDSLMSVYVRRRRSYIRYFNYLDARLLIRF